MLGSELQHRALKLEREQKQRLEKEKLRADKEKLLDDIAKRRRQQREEEASRRRAAAIAATELVSYTAWRVAASSVCAIEVQPKPPV